MTSTTTSSVAPTGRERNGAESTHRAPTRSLSLLDLSADIIIFMLPQYLQDIEDYVNVSSTCRALRELMSTTSPHTILRLVANSRSSLFNPGPYVVVCAVARQLGSWARATAANEAELAAGMPRGIDHLLALALRTKEIGLTTERIRELHALRPALIEPATELISRCVAGQARRVFMLGRRAIRADGALTFFLLATYGELFGPDLDRSAGGRRRLGVGTRLEFVKYCVPEWTSTEIRAEYFAGGAPDPVTYGSPCEIVVHPAGPYARDERGVVRNQLDHMSAMLRLLRTPAWRERWAEATDAAEESVSDHDVEYEYESAVADDNDVSGEQAALENIMQCQGLEALGIRPELAEGWKTKVAGWRKDVALLKETPRVRVAGHETPEYYPDLQRDLLVCIHARMPRILDDLKQVENVDSQIRGV
ncbi:hypothetical protein GGR53DRAFT_510477 [Hypoxylon sp. FL1150]|nr:hypothetical protein GGR53DRAFT_510477 [Hypoxylon sp. FL1150]